MSQSQRYVSETKPRTCPACGSTRVVAILYGVPTRKAFEEADAGRLSLGGCCLGNDDPEWRCVDCSVPIHRDALRT